MTEIQRAYHIVDEETGKPIKPNVYATLGGAKLGLRLWLSCRPYRNGQRVTRKGKVVEYLLIDTGKSYGLNDNSWEKLS